MRTGYWVFDEDRKEDIFIPVEELDPELLERLRAVPAIGGFCYAADDFMHLPLSTAPFYIAGGWLPRQGKGLIFAPAKNGKSFLAVQLARCIGSGDEFLGLATQQGRVLYIQFELGLEVLQSRMRETGQEYPNVFVGTSFSMKLDKDSGKEQLRKAIEDVKPQVVIIDPLYKAIAGDENLAQDVERITDFLDAVIERYDCSVLLIHHTGKNFEAGARGSSVIEGWVDSYIQVRKISKKGQPLRVSIQPLSMRHAELPPKPIIAELGSSFEFELVDTEDGEKTVTVFDKVQAYLRGLGSAQAKDIMSAGLGSRNPVQRALNKLVADGKAAHTERGIYEWKGEK